MGTRIKATIDTILKAQANATGILLKTRPARLQFKYFPNGVGSKSQSNEMIPKKREKRFNWSNMLRQHGIPCFRFLPQLPDSQQAVAPTP